MSRDRRARWCTDDRINSRHGDRARLGREWVNVREREREKDKRRIRDHNSNLDLKPRISEQKSNRWNRSKVPLLLCKFPTGVFICARALSPTSNDISSTTAATSSSITSSETGTSERESRGTPRTRGLVFSLTDLKEARKLAPEVRIKQIGMREDLLSIIRHTSSDHFSEEL